MGFFKFLKKKEQAQPADDLDHPPLPPNGTAALPQPPVAPHEESVPTPSGSAPLPPVPAAHPDLGIDSAVPPLPEMPSPPEAASHKPISDIDLGVPNAAPLGNNTPDLSLPDGDAPQNISLKDIAPIHFEETPHIQIPDRTPPIEADELPDEATDTFDEPVHEHVPREPAQPSFAEPVNKNKFSFVSNGSLFIRVEQFKSLNTTLNGIRKHVKENEDQVKNITQVDVTINGKYDKWKREIVDVQKKLLFVEQELFER